MLLVLLRADEGRIDNRIAETHLVAIACGDPLEGHACWTLKLLEDKAEELGYVGSIAREAVRRGLKSTNSSPRGTRRGAFLN